MVGDCFNQLRLARQRTLNDNAVVSAWEVFEHSYWLEVLSSVSWWVEASGQAAVPLDGLQAHATLPDTLPCC
jgi:hypothetical protein